MEDCSVKEAVVLSAVISRCHFPAIHLAAAMIKISRFEYSGILIRYKATNCIFMRFILQKRCTFPNKALDMLLEYFKAFENSQIEPSLIWHQILLLFVQNYISYFDEEKSTQIFSLIKVKKHYMISSVISDALKNKRSNT
ncbi:Bystin [Thelohanellus kitauei]|uniref:Bystin n=1 Tax=Thelohanellus kitauei TaxID=669202 RepID=A0A0C2NAK5_THEKT|nr:Bystin [Thelohanellus kitauei]